MQARDSLFDTLTRPFQIYLPFSRQFLVNTNSGIHPLNYERFTTSIKSTISRTLRNPGRHTLPNFQITCRINQLGCTLNRRLQNKFLYRAGHGNNNNLPCIQLLWPNETNLMCKPKPAPGGLSSAYIGVNLSNYQKCAKTL